MKPSPKELEILKQDLKLLSKKEAELIPYIMEGCNYLEISRILKKKASTIGIQVDNIRSKLRINTRLELVAALHYLAFMELEKTLFYSKNSAEHSQIVKLEPSSLPEIVERKLSI